MKKIIALLILTLSLNSSAIDVAPVGAPGSAPGGGGGGDHNTLINVTPSQHHTKTVSGDIDHDSILNVSTSDHHVKTVSGDIDHGGITGLGDDDHSQYHNDTRGDARYYQESEHLNVSAGAGDAGKPVVLDAAGHIDATMINDADVSIAHSATTGQTASDHHAKAVSGDIDHDSITGVSADDHHAEAHSIASHNDTTATGAELETLTDGSNSDALHVHASAAVAHSATTGQTASDHHAKTVSGDIDHDSITGVSTSDHHVQTVDTNTFTTIEVDGTPESALQPTLEFPSAQFTLTESPADEFSIALNQGGISHDSIADVSTSDHHVKTVSADIDHDSITGVSANDHHTPTVDTQRPYQPVFVLNGPFSTTETDIDGQRGFDGGQTFVDAVISIRGNAVSASTVLTINRDGASGVASVTATFTPATGNTTQDIALSGSLVVADGDFIWVDITTIPGSMDSLSVRMK